MVPFPDRVVRSLGLLVCLFCLTAAEPEPAFPRPGTRFVFPRDHGSHPQFSLEWWYVTGHLHETNGLRHGFQATFFRRSTPRSPGDIQTATPAFGDRQLYLAHMALLDGASGQFLHQERLNREGWDAFSASNTLDVRNGNWSLRWFGEADGRLELQGGIRAEASWRLTLTPAKPLVVFGTNGVSRKAAEPSAASHYLTFTRLQVSGTLSRGGQTHPVSGTAWMDHEFSSSQLGAGQVGWDWAGVQLDDGREIMAYTMRRTDGAVDPFSTLAWVDREGGVRHFGADSFQWEPEGRWRSPATGAEYPARVRLTAADPVTGRLVTLQLVPIHAAQELAGGLGGIAYWEGACRVLDATGREIGSAFLEMTGYAASMAGRL
ncbi:MAG: carotenoid 1,2-hydratase [Verrucomicrobia bacterium]|nr:carotenoid 1,2-hydratase [Verrucomicrobiota bacterium]